MVRIFHVTQPLAHTPSSLCKNLIVVLQLTELAVLEDTLRKKDSTASFLQESKMLVSCGAEGSIAVTQRFFCEFRFRFRVSASNSVMPGGSRISLKLLSYLVLHFALSWVVYPGRTICTCNNHRVPQSPSMQKKFSFPKIHSKASFAT